MLVVTYLRYPNEDLAQPPTTQQTVAVDVRGALRLLGEWHCGAGAALLRAGRVHGAACARAPHPAPLPPASPAAGRVPAANIDRGKLKRLRGSKRL